MPIFPYLAPGASQRLITEAFAGYDHRLKIPEGSFYETENLSSRHYPLLSPREPRGLVDTLSAPGGLIARDALAWVDGGTLYYNGLATPVSGLSAGEKQLVGMGAYILIFPDKRYYNTADASDFGSMEAELKLTGTVSYALCTADGRILPDPILSDTEPASPENSALWLDSSGGESVLRQYSQALSVWTVLDSVYTRITFSTQGQIPAKFSKLDGIEISGACFDCLNGNKILYALGGESGAAQDYIVLAGLIDAALTDENGSITLSRKLPQMDFVCQCQNRLWGCFYGNDGEKNRNEIYACALGDFKNWRQYLGLATDSWAASLGSDGVFTGAVSYLGSPCFFKEDRIHRVSVSATGAHRIDEIPCRGVQKGSGKSLCVVGERLFYKSRSEVCVWQGGFPQPVSAPLGERRYTEAAAGALAGRYYISMKDEAGVWQLFCYDSALDIWQREDSFHALCFAARGGELYALEADTGKLWAMTGRDGEPEGPVRWSAQSGLMHYQSPDRKYISRLSLYLSMAAGAELSVFLRYDSAGDWHRAGQVSLSGPGALTLPVRPRRCGHMELKLEGKGQVRLYSLARILEEGSDMQPLPG